MPSKGLSEMKAFEEEPPYQESDYLQTMEDDGMLGVADSFQGILDRSTEVTEPQFGKKIVRPVQANESFDAGFMFGKVQGPNKQLIKSAPPLEGGKDPLQTSQTPLTFSRKCFIVYRRFESEGSAHT